MNWLTKALVREKTSKFYSKEKQVAMQVAELARDRAHREARLCQRGKDSADMALQAAKSRCIRVATVTVQLREDYPEFNRQYDFPFEIDESTDFAGHVMTYDRTKYRELGRRESIGWKAELAQVQAAVKDAEAGVKEAEQALDAARAALNDAQAKFDEFN